MREHLTTRTDFEREALREMRSPEDVLHDAQRISELFVQIMGIDQTCPPEITETKALSWLACRLMEKLDLLAALNGARGARKDMQPEAGA